MFKIDYQDKIQTHLTESAKIKMETLNNCSDDISRAAEIINTTFKSGNKLLLCGNGGSAADCQHMATELVSSLDKDFDRPGLPAIALTTDTSFLTAYSNDLNFDNVFERQVLALGEEEDTLIAISTSGESKNILLAALAAKSINMRTIALTGSSGKLRKIDIDVVISVPSTNTQYIQETHLAIEHILCELVEQSLFDKAKKYDNK